MSIQSHQFRLQNECTESLDIGTIYDQVYFYHQFFNTLQWRIFFGNKLFSPIINFRDLMHYFPLLQN